jgi:hypothetical protein
MHIIGGMFEELFRKKSQLDSILFSRHIRDKALLVK